MKSMLTAIRIAPTLTALLVLSSTVARSDTNLSEGSSSRPHTTTNIAATHSAGSPSSTPASSNEASKTIETHGVSGVGASKPLNPNKGSTADISLRHTQTENKSQVHYGYFVDYTAAIFGILAVVFALFVLLLGYKGWTEFTRIMSNVDKEVATKLDSAVEKRAVDFLNSKLIPQLEAMFANKQTETVERLNNTVADELDRAKSALRSEVPKVLTNDEVCRQVVDLAVAEVGRKLIPSAPPSQPDEFEPNGGGK